MHCVHVFLSLFSLMFLYVLLPVILKLPTEEATTRVHLFPVPPKPRKLLHLLPVSPKITRAILTVRWTWKGTRSTIGQVQSNQSYYSCFEVSLLSNFEHYSFLHSKLIQYMHGHLLGAAIHLMVRTPRNIFARVFCTLQGRQER